MEVLISVKGKSGTDAKFDEFVVALHNCGIFERFEVSQITHPIFYFRNEIAKHILDHGLTSLFRFSILMEDITTPGMDVDELYRILEKFVKKLSGAQRLIIIDPYLYASSKHPDVVSNLFAKMISWIGNSLREIITYTNDKCELKDRLQRAVKNVLPCVKFIDNIRNDLHDRFWIDPDTRCGIVFGTSLNGLGMKLVLVDLLRPTDVCSILEFLQYKPDR